MSSIQRVAPSLKKKTSDPNFQMFAAIPDLSTREPATEKEVAEALNGITFRAEHKFNEA